MQFKTIFAALALLSGPLAAAPVSNAGLPDWMAGAWVMEDGAEWADETWTPPRGGNMLGAARSGFGPELTTWQSTRIQRKADGSLVLATQDKGGPATEFALVVSGPSSIEFANPAHTYPQRVRYERVGQLLIVELSKIDGSQAARWQYRLSAQGGPDM